MKKKAENNGIVSRGFVFGADGGGTKTIGLLANMDGLVLSRIQVGGSNQNVVGPREAAARLADVILQCSRQAGVDPGMIRAAVLGLAGAGGTQERKNLVVAIQSLLSPSLPAPARQSSERTRRGRSCKEAAGGGCWAMRGAGMLSVSKPCGF